MRRIALVLMLIVIMALPSFAQGTWSVGAALAGGNPMGDFGNFAKLGMGGVVWGAYNLDQNLSLTGKIGYLSFSGKDVTIGIHTYTYDATTIMPILVGGKYFFMPPGDMRVYGALELGMYNINVAGIGSATKVGFAPSVGGQYKIADKMNLDLNINYTYISTDNTSSTYLGFALGVEYALQ